MSEAEARQLACRYLAELDGESGADSVLLDDAIERHSFGWVFYYQHRKYVETGDVSFAYAGNAPLLVERATGRIHVLGTAHPTESYLENYQRTGDPHAQPGSVIVVETGLADRRTEAIRVLRDLTDASMGELSSVIAAAVAGQRPTLDLGTPEKAEAAVNRLGPVGLRARQLPQRVRG